jgi:mannosyltransferase
MTQTSDATGKTREEKQFDGIHQKPTHIRHLHRFVSYSASTWLLCILIGAIALAFNLYRLGAPSIWFDEAFSVELARQPLPLLWQIIWGPEPNMELYYLLLHFWLGFTGFLGLLPTEFVVRFPSAIFAALSSVLVFLLGRRFLGITAGIVASGLYLLNFLQLLYAQQTRSYSLQLLLICIAWYALFVALTQESHQKRWWACFIGATILAVYAHLFSLLILLAQIVAFGGLLILPGTWRDKARHRISAFIVSLVAIGVLIVPMLLTSLHGSKTGWLPSPHLHDVYNLFLTISANSKLYLLILFGFCTLGLLVSMLVYLPKGKELLAQFALYNSGDDKRNTTLQQYLPVAFMLLCWLVIPIVISYAVSQGSTRLFSTRYLVIILPPLFLLVGLGVASLRWRIVQLALTLILFFIAFYYVPLYYKSAQVEDWNSTVHWLEQRYQSGDGLVCYNNAQNQGCQIPVEYYIHAYPSAAQFTDDSPGAYSWNTFGPADPHTGYAAAVDTNILANYAAKHTHLFFIIGRVSNDAEAAKAKAAEQWLDNHYHLLGRIVTPTVTISLYATNSQSPT